MPVSGSQPGMICQWTSNTTITVYHPFNNLTFLLNFGTTGANALDTGTIQANERYRIFIIFPDTAGDPEATLASLSMNDPIVPDGYNSPLWAGYAFTDVSANLLRFLSSMNYFSYETPISIISSGNDTTPTTKDVSAYISTDSRSMVNFIGSLTPATGGNTALFRPWASGSMQAFMSASVAAVPQYSPISLFTIDGKFDYEVVEVGDSFDLSLRGFQFR